MGVTSRRWGGGGVVENLEKIECNGIEKTRVGSLEEISAIGPKV